MQKLILCTALSSLVVAFRTKTPRRQYADVDALYTYGCPRSASPGLIKSVAQPCFPGWRAWNGARFMLVGEEADQIPMLPAPAHYQHPMMDSYEFDVSQVSGNKQTLMRCSRTTQRWPWYRVGDMLLHARTPYIESAHGVSEWYGNLTDMATMSSYMQDPSYVKRRMKSMGWRLVGRGYDAGGDLAGGAQVSYLIQHPDTLECFLSFQGTNSAGDVITDAHGLKAHFCGLVQEGETCDLFEACTVKREGDSFVHMGFRDHLRRIVQSDLFQKTVRPNLGYCSKVNVGGHSLGGALSELFTACIARAPAAGQYGYEEDFKYMYWTKKTPKLMGEIDI